MQPEQNKKLSAKKKIIISLMIFIVSYLTFLVIWKNIEDYYGKGVLYITSNVVATIKGVDFESINIGKKGRLDAKFIIEGFKANFSFKFSNITFNAPLTFTLMATLFLFLQNRKRAYAEALLLLFSIHFICVFVFEMGRISYFMSRNYMDVASKFKIFELYAWYYLWEFMNALVIRFEPFLIGFYLYIRFSTFSFLVKK